MSPVQKDNRISSAQRATWPSSTRQTTVMRPECPNRHGHSGASLFRSDGIRLSRYPTSSVDCSGLLERLVQGERCVDEREMRERLREVPDLLARGADLLGVQPQVIRVGQHLLKG